mmetsp:Transcript_39069/g.47008  ORF Transcript_39069/g.47008 Transcript_39069/m.47008 type:complete len:93 (-) Transcript_39069:230-508(-)
MDNLYNRAHMQWTSFIAECQQTIVHTIKPKPNLCLTPCLTWLSAVPNFSANNNIPPHLQVVVEFFLEFHKSFVHFLKTEEDGVEVNLLLTSN